MKLVKRLLLVASIFAAPIAQADADDCICFHVTMDKDGNPSEVKSHDTSCKTHSYVTPLSSAGPAFEPTVLQRISRNAYPGAWIVAWPSRRQFNWLDTSFNEQTCKVPDITTSGEMQPARTTASGTAMVTFSLATLPSEWVPAARLAANGWNRSLAAAGKKTRLVEIADNANIGVIAGDLTKVLGMSYSDTQAVTWQFKGGLTSHPDWLAAPSTIALNIAFKANFAADGMLPVQLFGHEFGHALGLADVNGNQLMAGATQYTTNGEVTPSLPLGEYTPNICEVAKLADNGLP